MAESVEDTIGQMLVFGWSQTAGGNARSLNSHARRLIEEFRVGGVILMARNVGPPQDAKKLTGYLQNLAELSGLPRLLVSTDQEGGRVARFGPPDYPAFPSARTIGADGRIGYARQNAASIGRVLAHAGVNWALMPSLDVNNNPNNVVIGDRSFGDDPALVARLGAASIIGLQDDAGVMACGKHFPGHGDTAVDSHLSLPIIDHDPSRLDLIELPPFRAAIAAHVGSIMSSHILYRRLDAELPATLSPKILGGVLRETLGYDGVVVTDCLEMLGVAAKWGSAEAAVLAVIAGADMVLACHTEATQSAIRLALIDAVHSGRIAESRINDAHRRIKAAKKMYAN